MTHFNANQTPTPYLLPIMEEFYSLQGEGFHTGKPAYFLRIGGCDVGCFFCDVKESWDASKHSLVSTDEAIARILENPAKAVVVTGGEPMLYDLSYLCRELTNTILSSFRNLRIGTAQWRVGLDLPFT